MKGCYVLVGSNKSKGGIELKIAQLKGNKEKLVLHTVKGFI